MRLLPLGGELGAFLVVVVVGQLLARVRVPAERPEAVQVNLLAQGRGQSEHQDPRAQALRGELLRLPVPANTTPVQEISDLHKQHQTLMKTCGDAKCMAAKLTSANLHICKKVAKNTFRVKGVADGHGTSDEGFLDLYIRI